MSSLLFFLGAILYPASQTIQAFSREAVCEHRRCVFYWMLLSVVLFLDPVACFPFRLFPFAHQFLLLFLFWLVHPRTRGSVILGKVFFDVLGWNIDVLLGFNETLHANPARALKQVLDTTVHCIKAVVTVFQHADKRTEFMLSTKDCVITSANRIFRYGVSLVSSSPDIPVPAKSPAAQLPAKSPAAQPPASRPSPVQSIVPAYDAVQKLSQPDQVSPDVHQADTSGSGPENPSLS